MPRLFLSLSLSLVAVATPAAEPLSIWWAQWAPADGLQQLGDAYAKATGTPVKVHQIPWGSFQDQVFLKWVSLWLI